MEHLHVSATALRIYMNYFFFFKLHSNQWNRCWFSVAFFWLKEVTEAQGQLVVCAHFSWWKELSVWHLSHPEPVLLATTTPVL